MKNVKITYSDIMSWRPCHNAEKCLELLKGVESYTLKGFLNLDSVSTEDKFWVVLRKEVIPEKTMHEFAIFCALSVIDIFEKEYPNDKRPRLAIEAKQKWLKGEISDEELAAAAAAARYAAADAAAAAAAAAAADAAACAAAAAAYAARDDHYEILLSQLKIMLT